MMKARNNAYITGERAGVTEVGRVAGFGDDPGGRECADSRNCLQQLSDFVRVKPPLYIDPEFADPCPHAHYVFACTTGMQPIWLGGMLADRSFGGIDENAGERAADSTASIKTEAGQLPDRYSSQQFCRRIARENGCSEFGVETTHMARELRERQIERLVQVPHTVSKVLHAHLSQVYQ